MSAATVPGWMDEKALEVARQYAVDSEPRRRAGLQAAVVGAMQAAVSMVGIDELEQESRLMRARNERLQAELDNAKRLIVDVYGMLHPREQARQSIERRTGNWFVWGVDRAAPADGTEAQGTTMPAAPAPESRDAESLREIRKVSLHVAGDWPDLETDTHIVRRMKWLARYCNDNPPMGERFAALRAQVRAAWLTGVDDFRRLYDNALLAHLGIETFQDLYDQRQQPLTQAVQSANEGCEMQNELTAEPAKTLRVGAPYGIIDPDYARVYSQARIVAWQFGFALVMHGSFTRDLDLLLVPWEDRASNKLAEPVVNRIAQACGLTVNGAPKDKAHGRKAYTLLFPGAHDPRWVDLSVMPAAQAVQPLKTVEPTINQHIEGWRAQTQFVCEYKHGGKTWGLEFFAVDALDAAAKLKSIQESLTLLGVLDSIIPYDDEEKP